VPGALLDHLRDRELGHVEEPVEVHRRDRGVVVAERVVRERFADVDAGVVDERVDPPEPSDGLLDRTLCGFGVCDVAGDRDVVVPVYTRGPERQRNADDGIPGTAVSGDEPGADALRSARDDRDRRAHWTR
jgi:hypothetical protein